MRDSEPFVPDERPREKFLQAKRLIREGYSNAEAAKAVGLTLTELLRLAARLAK